MPEFPLRIGKPLFQMPDISYNDVVYVNVNSRSTCIKRTSAIKLQVASYLDVYRKVKFYLEHADNLSLFHNMIINMVARSV